MSKVNDENYYIVQGWMVKELGLKGTELDIYAIIYGFSQDGVSQYKAGLQYLADWTNTTKQSCINNLKSLIEKELICKEEIEINNIKLCNYYANIEKLDTIKKFLPPIKKSLTGIKKILPNNIYNNIDNNIKEKKYIKKEKATLEEIEDYIKQKGLNVDAKQFYDYFEEGNWIDSKGNKVKNWKQKLLTWNKYAVQKKEKKCYNYEQNDNIDYNSLYDN